MEAKDTGEAPEEQYPILQMAFSVFFLFFLFFSSFFIFFIIVILFFLFFLFFFFLIFLFFLLFIFLCRCLSISFCLSFCPYLSLCPSHPSLSCPSALPPILLPASPLWYSFLSIQFHPPPILFPLYLPLPSHPQLNSFSSPLSSFSSSFSPSSFYSSSSSSSFTSSSYSSCSSSSSSSCLRQCKRTTGIVRRRKPNKTRGGSLDGGYDSNESRMS